MLVYINRYSVKTGGTVTLGSYKVHVSVGTKHDQWQLFKKRKFFFLTVKGYFLLKWAESLWFKWKHVAAAAFRLTNCYYEVYQPGGSRGQPCSQPQNILENYHNIFFPLEWILQRFFFTTLVNFYRISHDKDKVVKSERWQDLKVCVLVPLA